MYTRGSVIGWLGGRMLICRSSAQSLKKSVIVLLQGFDFEYNGVFAKLEILDPKYISKTANILSMLIC